MNGFTELIFTYLTMCSMLLIVLLGGLLVVALFAYLISEVALFISKRMKVFYYFIAFVHQEDEFIAWKNEQKAKKKEQEHTTNNEQ